MNEFSDFIKIIKDFIELFEALISIEEKKLDAATKNRVSFVEDCMNKEQAAILRLRGLEKKREQAQLQLGMKDLTFRQILEKVPSDIESVLRPLFDQLSAQIRTFQSVSDSAKESIELNLHMIQSALEAQNSGTYSQNGNQPKDNTRHFTSRSV